MDNPHARKKSEVTTKQIMKFLPMKLKLMKLHFVIMMKLMIQNKL